MNKRAMGWLIPRLVFIGLVADLSLRFVPLKEFSFRAWEGARQYATATGPFTPDFFYKNGRSHGDLPAFGNRPEFSVFRPESFAADAEGFRRNETASPQGYDSILVGDSFAAGSGVDDSDTLASQLERAGTKRVYNAGSMPVKTLNIVALADRLGMTRGTILYEYMERQDLPTVQDVAGLTPDHRFGPRDGWSWGRLRQIVSCCWNGYWQSCPLEILCQRVFHLVENDRIFPNPHMKAVTVGILRNQRSMLFFSEDVQLLKSDRPTGIEGLSSLSQGLHDRNLSLVVVLVPTKYTVYRTLLADQRGHSAPSGVYLSEVKDSLDDAGIPVINLTPVFLKEAAQAIQRNEYIYWPDDTHWNAAGIHLAAEAVAPALNR